MSRLYSPHSIKHTAIVFEPIYLGPVYKVSGTMDTLPRVTLGGAPSHPGRDKII